MWKWKRNASWTSQQDEVEQFFMDSKWARCLDGFGTKCMSHPKKTLILALWCFQGKNLRTLICMLKLRVWSWWEAKMKLAKRANQWLRHGFKLHCLTIIRIAALRFFNIFTPVSQPQLFIMTSSLFVWIIRNFFNCNVIAISV